jgi:hypothetical protein
MTADHQTWVPHLRGVLVFVAKVGYHERKPVDVMRRACDSFEFSHSPKKHFHPERSRSPQAIGHPKDLQLLFCLQSNTRAERNALSIAKRSNVS